jgi:hypothetical protein
MISRELVLELLRQKQDSSGGYTGDDIIEIAAIPLAGKHCIPLSTSNQTGEF